VRTHQTQPRLQWGYVQATKACAALLLLLLLLLLSEYAHKPKTSRHARHRARQA
jgi:hypothetical protein